MSAQPQEESLERAEDGRIVYLAPPPDEHRLRNERALFLIEQSIKTGMVNLPELKAVLKGRHGF